MTEAEGAKRLLAGLETGSLGAVDSIYVAEQLDPVLVYTIVSFLRAVYPASDPAATSVLERVVTMTTKSKVVIAKHREGASDPISSWFESEHDYGEFRGRGAEMIDVLVDKLES